MASAAPSQIARANAALGRYYKQQNRAYNNEFREWADENGFDSEGIEEELEVDASDSTLIEIDSDFPGTVEAAQIVAILQRCWSDPIAYTNEVAALTVTASDWQIDDKLKKDTIKLYQSQCKTIFDGGMKGDQAIIKLLAVGQKLDKPYLQFLSDMYSRDRLCHKDSSLQPADWALKNKHCMQLKAMPKTDQSSKPITETISAVGSFFHRIVPKLMLNTQTEIIDSLEQTARYIAAAVDFVWSLTQNQATSCPFQVDSCIAFNEARDCSTMALQGVDVDDDDDGDDDDDDDEKAIFGTEFFDCFGNIKDRLSKESLLHSTSIIDESENKENVRSARMFNIEFQKFKNQEISKKYKDKKEFSEYPRKHRFCSLIDRRKPDDSNNNNKGTVNDDEIIFFEPPNNCNTLPGDKHVPLWYFDSSRTCIIPSIGYCHGKYLNDIDAQHNNNQNIKDAKEKALSEPVTSSTPCKGALLVLSFHVESASEIRAYLYLNGQITRFLPEDIITILPRFFDVKFGNNKDFPASDIAKELVERMKPRLKDIHFEAFYNEYKNK